MYSIGKVAELSNCTVRTLRYYDEIDLLKPSKISDGGHRYYDQEGITRLHYILTLKEMGFPLEMIQEILSNHEWSIKEALFMQLDFIQSEQKRLRKMNKTILSILQLIELEGTSNWKEIFKSLVVSNDQEKLWMDYFSDNEQKEINKLPVIGENSPEIRELMELIHDIRKEMQNGPTTEAAKLLAERWISLVNTMFSGNTLLAQKVWTLNKNEEQNIGFYKFDKKIITFIEQAIAYFYPSGGD